MDLVAQRAEHHQLRAGKVVSPLQGPISQHRKLRLVRCDADGCATSRQQSALIVIKSWQIDMVA
jgi:hypothetical protein